MGVRSALLSEFERAGRRTGESGRAVQFFQCIILRWCAGMPAKFGRSKCSLRPRRRRSDRWDRAGCFLLACVPISCVKNSIARTSLTLAHTHCRILWRRAVARQRSREAVAVQSGREMTTGRSASHSSALWLFKVLARLARIDILEYALFLPKTLLNTHSKSFWCTGRAGDAHT